MRNADGKVVVHYRGHQVKQKLLKFGQDLRPPSSFREFISKIGEIKQIHVPMNEILFTSLKLCDSLDFLLMRFLEY